MQQCKRSFNIGTSDGVVVTGDSLVLADAFTDGDPDDSKCRHGGYMFGDGRYMIVYPECVPRPDTLNVKIRARVNGKNYEWPVGQNVRRMGLWPVGAQEAPALNEDGLQINPIILEPSAVPFRRPQLTLGQLAAIQGAMWSTRWQNKRYGPSSPQGNRPGTPDNILAMDYYEWYPQEERFEMRSIYSGDRKLKFAVTGPLIDDGYHGHFPAQHTMPTDAQLSHYLDCMQEWWAHTDAQGNPTPIIPVHFIRPDGWNLQRVKDQFTEFYSDSRTKDLLPVQVPTGWEPTDYGWSSYTWNLFRVWALSLNPTALMLMHTPSELDCPNGKDENGDDSAEAAKGDWGTVWHRHVEHCHGWLVQNGPYGVKPGDNPPDNPNMSENFAGQFKNQRGSLYDRFHNGYAGWPTHSAWGPNTPICIYNGECTAYASYWENLPEATAQQWGDLALTSGADGYLDGGTLSVPVKR